MSGEGIAAEMAAKGVPALLVAAYLDPTRPIPMTLHEQAHYLAGKALHRYQGDLTLAIAHLDLDVARKSLRRRLLGPAYRAARDLLAGLPRGGAR